MVVLAFSCARTPLHRNGAGLTMEGNQPLYRIAPAIAPGVSFCDWPDFTSNSRYDMRMKPLPAPIVPGKTEAERFDNAVRKTFTVSKDELARREAEWQKTHSKRSEAKKP